MRNKGWKNVTLIGDIENVRRRSNVVNNFCNQKGDRRQNVLVK